MSEAINTATDPSDVESNSSVVKWIAIGVTFAALLYLTRVLPFDKAIGLLQSYVQDLGWIGPVVFGIAYVAAALLFVPGSILTLAAGAIFGLVVGTLTVIFSASTAAGLAFLLARYAFRDKIKKLAETRPKFAAIDTAIAEGGWKIVGLLRLSPAVPFSIANYLFGLTKVGFLRYVVTSFFAMMPGTFMYVYLGYAGRASAGGGGRSPMEWVLLGVGLLATIVVTVYVTKLAKKALAEKTELSEEDGGETEQDQTDDSSEKGSGTLVWVAIAAAAVALAVLGTVKKDAISAALGPPQVELKEKFERRAGGPVFDHSALDRILSAHVDADGWVDYAALESKRGDLQAYLTTLGSADLEPLGRDERLAFYINAYNAYTLELILDHRNGGSLKSIKDIPREDRWDGVRWLVAGNKHSLNQIEHVLIREQFKEPRIHFAVNCASVGCPPLRNEAFTGKNLETQLEEQTQYVHDHPRWFSFDPASGKLKLTSLYKWYGSDFVQVEPSVIAYAAKYSTELAAALASGKDLDRSWLDYDWSLNSAVSGAKATGTESVNASTTDGTNAATGGAVLPASTKAPASAEGAGENVSEEPAAQPGGAVTAAKPVAKKAPTKAPAKKGATKKTQVKKAATKKTQVKKAAAKKAPTERAPAEKAQDRKAQDRKAQDRKAPAEKPKPVETKPSDGGGAGSSGGGGSSGAPIPRGFR